MWRVALNALAAGSAGRRLAGYARNLTARYLILGVALIVALAGACFAALAAFWALNSWTQDPMRTALVMTAIFFVAALSIAAFGYGITREKTPALEPAPRVALGGAEAYLPAPEDIGREIENAVRRHGPLPVAAAAVAGGFVAALLAKRFTQAPAVYEYEPPRYRRRRRR
jgi:cytochrome bd-type quinol oxidase subunit 2